MSEKSKKTLLGVAFLSIFTVGIIAGICVKKLESPDKQIIYEAQLNGALRIANKYGIEYVHLKDLTDFEWEKVCVILPYMSNEKIAQKTGVKYYDFTDHDGQWGLLFIDKHKKLIPIKINRVRTVDAVISYDEKHGFKGAVYCADKGSAKLIFYEKQFANWPKEKLVALVQQ